MLKAFENIKEKDDENKNVYTIVLLKRYTYRRANHEDVTLADWAAWYCVIQVAKN